MMSSNSTPDFRATLRRQQRPNAPSLSSSSSVYGLSAQSKSGPPTQPTTATAPQPPLDPTFEPLERAGRAINDGIRKDDRFPELDQLVQRLQVVDLAD
jgi:hypothetical protein